MVNTLEYSFDAASQLLDASNNNSSYALTYDQLGRRTSTDNLGTPGAPNIVLSSSFDAIGNRTALSATIDGLAALLVFHGIPQDSNSLDLHFDHIPMLA